MSITLDFRIVPLIISDFLSIIHTMSVYINTGLGNSDVEGLWSDTSQHSIEELEKEREEEH